jgi:hypothetical protein
MNYNRNPDPLKIPHASQLQSLHEVTVGVLTEFPRLSLEFLSDDSFVDSLMQRLWWGPWPDEMILEMMWEAVSRVRMAELALKREVMEIKQRVDAPTPPRWWFFVDKFEGF